MFRFVLILLAGLTLNAAEYNGYLESRFGVRLHDNTYSDKMTISELRLQLQIEEETDDLTFTLVSDFIAEGLDNKQSQDFHYGTGPIDLRQANVEVSPFEWMDMKIGRQIVTWGTGDLLFINDLFPKDWNAFIKGMNVEYLKAPTDSIKASVFFDDLSLDIVYTPLFMPDRYVNGEDVSFYDRSTTSFYGEDNVLQTDTPNQYFSDDEIALRLYQSINAYEVALYYYNGFWKSPSGFSATSGEALFDTLSVYGASVRGVLANGIASAEIGYYDSESSAATNPLKRNSEFRWLVGYEQEIATEFTASIQYYEEIKDNYREYENALPSGSIIDDKTHQVVTMRLTKYLLKQDLKLSYFQFYSPSDNDAYTRLAVVYKFNDNFISEVGANIFYGDKDHTFYSQFEENTNAYISLRYAY